MAKTRKSRRKAAAPRPVWKLTLESPKRPKNSKRLRNFKCRRIYHVFQRGNEGRRAFRCDEERVAYLQHLFFLGLRYQVKIHNFCLMPTHVHLILEQRQTEGISNLMRELQSTHARVQNTRRNSYGNLWTQHFGCKHVSTPAYFRTLTWYLGNNPVKSGAVKKAVDYQWSGARVLEAGGEATILFKGHKIPVALHMDEYDKVCRDDEWRQVLARGDVGTEMRDQVKQIESIYDKKAVKHFAYMEEMRRLNALRAKQRESKKNKKKFGVGKAKQAQGSRNAANRKSTKAKGKGSEGSMRAG